MATKLLCINLTVFHAQQNTLLSLVNYSMIWELISSRLMTRLILQLQWGSFSSVQWQVLQILLVKEQKPVFKQQDPEEGEVVDLLNNKVEMAIKMYKGKDYTINQITEATGISKTSLYRYLEKNYKD